MYAACYLTLIKRRLKESGSTQVGWLVWLGSNPTLPACMQALGFCVEFEHLVNGICLEPELSECEGWIT